MRKKKKFMNRIFTKICCVREVTRKVFRKREIPVKCRNQKRKLQLDLNSIAKGEHGVVLR